MIILTNIVISLVAILHFYFMVLEMFFWTKPLGLKIFKNTKDKAEMTSVLAANQGLYNGFLAMGLIMSQLFSSPTLRFSFQVYFLACIVVAGIYGAYSVSRRIFFIQALPAIIGIILVISFTH